MNEEEFMLFVLTMFGAGALGYFVGKARAAKWYLERFADEVRGRGRVDDRRGEEAELAKLRAAVEAMSHRFDLMEQRVDFTERLVESAQRKTIARSEEEWMKGR